MASSFPGYTIVSRNTFQYTMITITLNTSRLQQQVDWPINNHISCTISEIPVLQVLCSTAHDPRLIEYSTIILGCSLPVGVVVGLGPARQFCCQSEQVCLIKLLSREIIF